MSLTIIIGPMFSGKTTRLLEHGRQDAQTRYIKHCIDTRYDTASICTHDGAHQMASVTETLCDVDVTNVNRVCIDEGHFFSDLHVADQWAQQGKHVFVAGLISDKHRQAFASTTLLLPACDRVEVLYSRCQCGQLATFTKRNTPTEDQDFYVGGRESYTASCRTCFDKPVNK
jgi:thymidine kinase